MYSGYVTDVDGIIVGHEESLEGMTGCTVIIAEEGATGGVDVRGSAPGTRETDLFKAEKMVDKVHAVVLAGGSAFGLEASSGVMDYLEGKGVGFDVGVTKVPIVASAVIFDLLIGDPKIRPDKNMGYKAAMNASKKEDRQGSVGCGKGATVGKILGPDNAMKSGLGSATVRAGNLTVSAIVIVNSFGDIFHKNTQIAGVYDYKDNKMLNTEFIMKQSTERIQFSNTNTTIGVVATNAILTKAEGNKVAQTAHNGLARTINPVHTAVDGDTLFVMATNKVQADINLVAMLSAEAVEKAVVNAVLSASPYKGMKTANEI
ncbi:P1 family peptidase [Gudongella sp. DL1XJH-153]|uniref:P1 family peptidase n=1 Tax=Gudongella sp. DL1XJH-153 TaxID=3409804 RepID=UPI003BB80BBB